ncbi:zinc finger, CCHC-type, retrotransposon gag domain protein, partial [Tanacetum coccineum]
MITTDPCQTGGPLWPTNRGKCWHEDCRNCGKPGHATKDCKADWVCFRCKKPRHKIVDCPERSQDPQEKTGYSGNRVSFYVRNAEAQGDGCSYKSFLNCKPSEFHGDSDPVIVTNWLREIEDIFKISECSPRQRVKYASHLLKGEARHWWNMIKIARGNDVASVMTWEEFEDLVMKNY